MTRIARVAHSDNQILGAIVADPDPLDVIELLQVLNHDPHGGAPISEPVLRGARQLAAEGSRPGAVHWPETSGAVVLAIGRDDEANLDLARRVWDRAGRSVIGLDPVPQTVVAAEMAEDMGRWRSLRTAVQAALENPSVIPADFGLFEINHGEHGIYATRFEPQRLTVLLASARVRSTAVDRLSRIVARIAAVRETVHIVL